jgi:hypothetical protein
MVLEKRSPPHIVQSLFAARNLQWSLANQKLANPDIQIELDKLQEKLKAEILSWGGITAIEEWLKKYDTGCSLPSQIEGIDLSWLNE